MRQEPLVHDVPETVRLRPETIRAFYRQRSRPTWAVSKVSDSDTLYAESARESLFNSGRHYANRLSMDILPHDRAARRTNLLAQRELDRNMSEGTISNLEPIDGVWWTGDLQVKRRDIIGSVAKPLTDFHLAYIDIVSSIDFQINCVIEESTGDEQEKAESDAKVDVYKGTDLDETLWTVMSPDSANSLGTKVPRKRHVLGRATMLLKTTDSTDEVFPQHYLESDAPMPVLLVNDETPEYPLAGDSFTSRLEDGTRGRKHVYQTRLSSKNDRGGSHSYVGKAWFRHAQQEMTEVARV